MSIEESLVKQIKEVIQERGLQYKFICKKLGIEQVKFSQCLNGKRKFRVSEFLILCKFLGLSFDDFKEWEIV